MTKLNRWNFVRALSVFCLAMIGVLQAQTFTTLANFDGIHGVDPDLMVFVQGPDGFLYGTTYYGGNTNCNDGTKVGCGAIFKISTQGKLQTLHLFNSSDGSNPAAGLILAADGNFYGTTQRGGSGLGTVFKMTPDGTLTTLHIFAGSPDGDAPYSPLTQASDGNLYGTTAYGGASKNCTAGCGTTYSVNPAGTVSIVHSFGKSDGALPVARLIQASDGNLYGTTGAGGSNNFGTIFKFSLGGGLSTVHNFDQGGYNPIGGVIQASDGNFYGTTVSGGDGTIFRVTPGGSLTTIYRFQGSDGSQPFSGLTQASDGNFYGTTSLGGGQNYGTVFSITPSGKLTTLHSFAASDGAQPMGALLQAADGIVYGATFTGGPVKNGTIFHGFGHNGTVFSLDLGLRDRVSTGSKPR